MKTLSQLLSELTEALGIYTNPNAYEPKGGHYETPRERELRLQFARSPRGQALIAAAQRRDANALKKIQQQQKSGLNLPRLPGAPFPWKRECAGWWHAVKPSFTFSHSRDGYHITQVVKNPQRFGVTDSEMDQALNEYIQKMRLNSGGLDPRSRDYYERTIGLEKGEKIEASGIKGMIKQQIIDLCPPLAKRAFDKGWLKVYGAESGSCSLEGTNMAAFKAAVREILSVMGDKTSVTILEITPSGKEKHHYIDRGSEAESFLLK